MIEGNNVLSTYKFDFLSNKTRIIEIIRMTVIKMTQDHHWYSHNLKENVIVVVSPGINLLKVI